jgi:hypothetical protein
MSQASGSRTYGTSDIWLAAYLKAKGLRLVGTEREGRRCCFLFEDRPDREHLVLDFVNQGVVEIAPYRHALDDLKAIVYNA